MAKKIGKAPQVREINLGDLVMDSRNANTHNEAGMRILEKSLRKLGAGRSVLVDKNGKIIAGNGTVEKSAILGMKAIEVETDGDTLVVVKRRDLDLDSSKGREMALADNQTQKKNLQWDFGIIDGLARDFMIDGDFIPKEPTERKKKPMIQVEFSNEEDLERYEAQITAFAASVCPVCEIKVRRR